MAANQSNNLLSPSGRTKTSHHQSLKHSNELLSSVSIDNINGTTYVVSPLHEQYWYSLNWIMFIISLFGGLVWLNYNVAFSLIGIFFIGKENSYYFDKARINLFFLLSVLSYCMDIAWVGWYSTGLSSYSSSNVAEQTNMFIFSWASNVLLLVVKGIFLLWLYWIRQAGHFAFMYQEEINQAYTNAEELTEHDDEDIVAHDFVAAEARRMSKTHTFSSTAK